MMVEKEDDNVLPPLSTMDTKKDVSSFSFLGEDMVLEILSRLPIKSLFRFKCVSKSWFSLIHPNLSQSRSINSSMLGFFCHRRRRPPYMFESAHDPRNEDIDTALSFLPCHPDTEIIDSCNGLLICRHRPRRRPRPRRCDNVNYYVCNPATKRWVVLPHLPSVPKRGTIAVHLAYNPCVSSHFKVIFARFSGWPSKIHIFSSKNANQGWVENNINLHVNPLCFDRSIHRHRVFKCWPLLHYPTGFFNDGALYKTNRNHIIRYSRLDGEDQDPHHTIIMLPFNTWDVPSVGILWGSICCGCLSGPHLRIWTLMLNGEDGASWVLKHNNEDITEHCQGIASAVIVAFHASSEVVLIQTKEGIFGYNLSDMTKVDYDGLRNKTMMFVFPYTPCYHHAWEINN